MKAIVGFITSLALFSSIHINHGSLKHCRIPTPVPANEIATQPSSVQITIPTTPVRSFSFSTSTAFNNYLINADSNGGPQYGDWVDLTAGNTFTGTFTLPAPTGTQTTNYVIIQGSGCSNLPANTRVALSDVSQMATLIANPGGGSNPTLAFANSSGHYIIRCLNFTVPQTPGYQIVIDTDPTDQSNASLYPNHVLFDRIIIKPNYDFGANKCLVLYGTHMAVRNSYITDCMQTNQGDANPVWMQGGVGPYEVSNNRIEGMGENVFTGGSSDSYVAVTPGVEYAVPANQSILRNYIRRKGPTDTCSYDKRDSNYCPQSETAGSGTFTSSGTTITFSTSQSGLTNKYLRDTTSLQQRKITAGSGTSWTLASAFSPDVGSAHSWRYNAGDLVGKNLIEWKAGERILVEGNVFENGYFDGQPYAITITPREFGYVRDLTFRYNRITRSDGMSLSLGDAEQGYQYGPSPYSTVRIGVHDNVWENISSLSGDAADQFVFSVWGTKYGYFNFPASTIAAGATTGSSVTFTASSAIFNSSLVGLEIRYDGGGAATISSVNGNKLTLVANITSAFPDTSTHTATSWSAGPTSKLGTYYQADSWYVEHNTSVGASTGFQFMMDLIDNSVGGSPPKATNFVYRNNITFFGAVPLNGAGVRATTGNRGTNALNDFTDSATRLFRKNVVFGPSANSFIGEYTGNEAPSGAGNGGGTPNQTAFHWDDQTGASGGGAIGFTDYANKDYSLTSGSQYHLWGSDGKDPGVDWATYQSKISGVAP